jgi:serine protease
MIKRAIVLLILALTTTSLLAAETTRYMVSLRSTAGKKGLRVMSNSAELTRHRVRRFENFNAFAADLTADEVAELKASGLVESISPVVERRLLGEDELPNLDVVKNAVRYGQEQVVPWGVITTNAAEVWPVTRGAAHVNVAVIDTGIDFSHPDLEDAYAGGYNVFETAAEPMDDHRHGTHVAGTIAAADNAFGVVGVAPQVKVWAVKVLDDDGKGTDETLTAGIDWVITKAKEVGGRWVVNMSLGSRFGSDIEKAAIERAVQANIVIVAAAGNTGLPFLNYPAGYPGVIAVGATDSTNAAAKFSTYGVGLSVVAPGVSVPSTFRGGLNTSADVTRNDVQIDVRGITGSPFKTVTGRLVDCGYGYPEDFPSDIRGRVALIQRGGPPGIDALPFRDKARNAKEAGASAVVIYNGPNLPEDVTNWTLVFRNCTISGCTIPPEWVDYEFPLTVGATAEIGASLKEWINRNVTVGFRPEDYGNMSGTSMASPHVAGAAALLLSLAPDLNAAQVGLALEKTATDLDVNGWDQHTAWGLINIGAAAKYVAPAAFGLPPSTITNPKRRSSGGH